MMSEVVIEKFKEKLDEISKYLKEKNFRACDRITLDLIRLSYYFNYSDGVFFSECMEHIFDNLERLYSNYTLDEKETHEIIDRNVNFINALKESLPQLKNIKDLYELSRDARNIVTRLQFKYSRVYEAKRMFPSVSITEE
jgi:hypothetical protein